VDQAGVIIAGHTRLLGAKKLGLQSVPVHIAANLTPTQVRAYRLMDNRSHEESSWDVDFLTPELTELQALNLDLNLTGFDTREIDALLLAEEDLLEQDIPEPPENPVTRPGDLWVLGDHRVICADATDPNAVARLCGTKCPNLMVTDP